MTPLTCGEAARIDFAPHKSYLSRLAKRSDRPGYFVHTGDRWEIDIDHPEFIALLRCRAKKLRQTTPVKAMHKVSNVLAEIKAAKIAKLKEDIRGLRIKNQRAELDLQRQSENLIEVDLCNHIFADYLDRLQGATGPMVKRLQVEVEELLSQSMHPGADPRTLAKQISRRIIESEESIIRDTKEATAQAVKDLEK